MFSIVALFLLSTLASATNLFIADYSGNITTLSLTEQGGNYSATVVSTSNKCAPSPSWLTVDSNRGLLFCLNEGPPTTNGSISSFTINPDGSLSHVKNVTTIAGPVSGVIYGYAAGQRGLAVAHYGGSAVTSWLLKGYGEFQHNQVLIYTLSKPGPNPNDRQTAPYEHEAILDPTGQYILVPDLGADLVRVYSWDENSLKLKALDSLKAAPGSGPRHAAFWNPYSVACESCTTYLYVVAELAATVTGYAVTYKPNGGGMSFSEVHKSTTMGKLQLQAGSVIYPAEVLVAPDNKFLVISNRNDSSLTADVTGIKSDSLATFALQANGSLTFHRLWPADGIYFPKALQFQCRRYTCCRRFTNR